VNGKACIYCEDCLKKCEDFGVTDAIKIGMKNDKFIFVVESTGTMEPIDIIKKSFIILKENLG
jgi:hypothetical protein